MASSSSSSSTTRLSKPLQLGQMLLSPGDAVGRYIYEDTVGKGGMAWVLRVREPETGEVRALKVLRSAQPGTGLARFKREFRALSRLRHDNIIRVDDFGDLAGHACFTMEYVAGRDLHQEIRSWKSLSLEERWARTEDALADLAQALGYIHRRGLVHRDLKPSNVLIDRNGRCKLTDFGIVKELDPSADAFVSRTLVGTWAYASPEQISGAPLDHRSDLYSLGVILYAMITGRRPFVARDMAGYLAQHRDTPPRPPVDLVPSVPPHLNDICLRLLRKAPRERFQAASDILSRLSRTDPGERLAAGPSLGWEPPLVGRVYEVGLLRDAVSQLTRRAGGVVLVEGAEGHGRSRMLGVAEAQARRIGMPVHTVRLSSQQGASRVLVAVADQLERDLGADGSLELHRAIRDFTKGGGRLAGDVRFRLFEAIRAALARLLELGPMVLGFDDLHLAPTPLLQLLGYLSRTCIARDGLPLLLAATVRTDRPTPALRGFRDGTELGLAPLRVELSALEPGEVAALVEAVLGNDDPRVATLTERLVVESGGSALLVAETLRTWRELPVLGDEDDEDAATEVVPVDVQVPPAIRQAVARRLSGLDAPARALVEALGLHGQELDLDVLVAVGVAGSDGELVDDDVIDLVDDLIDRELVVERRVGARSVVELTQPRDGEVLRRDLPEPRRVRWHGLLARALENSGGDRVLRAEAIGEHYRKAGEAGPAWWHLTQAATGLWDRSLVGEAEAVAERARQLEAAARKSIEPQRFARGRVALLKVRSAVLYNRGRWLDARQALSALRGAALVLGDDAQAAAAGLDLGSTLRRLGLEEEGQAMVEAVLGGAQAVGEQAIVVDALHRLAVFAWEAGDLGTCEARAVEALRLAEGLGVGARRAHLLTARAAVHASRGQVADATAQLTEAVQIHRSLGDKRAEAVAMGNLAELACLEGRLGTGAAHADAALSLSRAVLYREGEAFVLRVRAMVHLAVGELTAAAVDLRATLDMLDDIGGGGDTVAARYYLARVLLERGRSGAAQSQIEPGLVQASQSDPESYGPLLRALGARAAAIDGGEAEAAATVEELARMLPLLPVPRRTLLTLELADTAMLMGNLEQTASLARDAAALATGRRLRVWGLRAWMLLAESADTADEAQAARVQAARLAGKLRAEMSPAQGPTFEMRPGVAGLLLEAELG